MLIPRAVLIAILVVSASVATFAFFGAMLCAVRKRPVGPRWLIALGGWILCAIFGFVGLLTGRAIVFEEHDRDLSYHRYIVVGSATVEVGGHPVELEYTGKSKMDETWILNNAEREVLVDTAAYGHASTAQVGHRVVAPGEALLVGAVDNFGPDEGLPGWVDGTSPDVLTWVHW